MHIHCIYMYVPAWRCHPFPLSAFQFWIKDQHWLQTLGSTGVQRASAWQHERSHAIGTKPHVSGHQAPRFLCSATSPGGMPLAWLYVHVQGHVQIHATHSYTSTCTVILYYVAFQLCVFAVHTQMILEHQRVQISSAGSVSALSTSTFISTIYAMLIKQTCSRTTGRLQYLACYLLLLMSKSEFCTACAKSCDSDGKATGSLDEASLLAAFPNMDFVFQ